MSLTTPQLVQKLPPSWWGLFGAMRLDHHHDNAAAIWYQTEANSEYGGHPDWDELLAGLLVKEPVCEGADLIFKPRFVQLPSDIQCHFLRFVLQHRGEIPPSGLSDFVEDVQCYYGASESWQSVLLKTLAAYNKLKSQESDDQLSETCYTFTSRNQNLATSLCDRLKKSTEQCSWKKIPVKKLPESHDISEIDRIPQNMETCDDHHQRDPPHSPGEADPPHSPGEADPPHSPGEASTPTFPGVKTIQHMDNAFPAGVITILSDDDDDTAEVMMEVTEPCSTVTKEGDSQTDASMKAELTCKDKDIDPVLLGKGEKLKESWQSGSETPPEIDLFLIATPDQIKSVALALNFCSLTDSEVLSACQSLTSLASILSEAASVQFMRSVVHPKIADLKHSASRQLLGVISLSAERFPRGLIEGVFVKCVEQGLGSAQTDVFCKVIKTDLQDSARAQMIKKMIECTKRLDEHVVCIYQTLIDTKVELSESMLKDMVVTFHTNSCGLEKNLKYGKLLLAVVNKYGHKFTIEILEVMEKEVQKNETFLRKALRAALNKIRK
ncbi:Fanconi anemia group E protein-like [Mizuhopecten yessoensis]|uniref:Fanconi anemia group E protein n=1 Tax=Mizuhopecten yessoensis TaxID=6573 RepID=A0A210R1C0_MIZYE|nr:Fanconi anemia group E protein-like [Mizuhopecten yessoensis]OWF54744.1 Fanconi anemia group E protein [Mizuhopecten yessoensis]